MLARTVLGRLGVIVDGRPEIYPVNRVFDAEHDCVVFRTNARTKLHAALDWPWVAFEVDGIEPGNSGAIAPVDPDRADEDHRPPDLGRRRVTPGPAQLPQWTALGSGSGRWWGGSSAVMAAASRACVSR